jgi:uncharacterized protein (DUF1810 family)
MIKNVFWMPREVIMQLPLPRLKAGVSAVTKPPICGKMYHEMAKRYTIADLPQAAAYLAHPITGPRLIEISKVLLALPGNDAKEVMGSPDDLKLQSSMTLFSLVPATDPVFEAVLKKYFDAQKDPATCLAIKGLQITINITT